MIEYNQDGIEVRRSARCDIERFAGNLRAADISEIWAAHRREPDEAVRMCVEDAMFSCVVYVAKQPAAIFGINPKNILGREATIWMLSTDELEKIGRRFVRHSRRYIDIMLDFYPYLFNYVDARNSISIKWLRWCGARIMEAKPYGPDKIPFHFFYFSR